MSYPGYTNQPKSINHWLYETHTIPAPVNGATFTLDGVTFTYSTNDGWTSTGGVTQAFATGDDRIAIVIDGVIKALVPARKGRSNT
jgi:hypothetical protein